MTALINLLSCRGPPNTLFPISHQDVKSHFLGQFWDTNLDFATMASSRGSISQTIIHISSCFLPMPDTNREFAPENEGGLDDEASFLGVGPCARANISNWLLHLPQKGAVTMEAKTSPRLNTSFLQGFFLPTPNFLYYEQIPQNYQQHFINFDSSKIWVPFHDCWAIFPNL